MDSVFRVALVYLFLMALFRLAGRRTLADVSPFDLVLLLIISELVQQAIVADDPSLTNALILCSTLVLLDIGLSLWKQRSPRIDRLIEGTPVLLVQHGAPIPAALRAMRIDESDILASARLGQGLERMSQIRFAVLEKNGGISIIPEPDARG
jgi:uncharacterized membrane protein YcaP (DUF421 family)